MLLRPLVAALSRTVFLSGFIVACRRRSPSQLRRSRRSIASVIARVSGGMVRNSRGRRNLNAFRAFDRCDLTGAAESERPVRAGMQRTACTGAGSRPLTDSVGHQVHAAGADDKACPAGAGAPEARGLGNEA